MTIPWALFLIYILISVYFTILIVNSDLTEIQKKLNLIMIWIIPVFWGLVVKFVLKPNNYKEKKKDQTNYHESEIGFHGGHDSTGLH